MFRIPLGCGAICIALFAAADARAQLVRIGPLGGVRIRVPFVSVDVAPWGATRVRAPFTAVDTPGYGYGHPSYPYYGPRYDLPGHGAYSLPYEAYTAPYEPYAAPYRPYTDPSPMSGVPPESYAAPSRPYRSDRDPSGDLPAELPFPYSPYDADWLRSSAAASQTQAMPAEGGGGLPTGRLQPALVSAALRLRDALDSRSDGQVWQDYLQPDRIAEIVRDDGAVERSTSEPRTEQLSDVLDNFDGVTANASLDWVTRLDGFDATHQLLRQWLTPQPAAAVGDGQPPTESAHTEELPLPTADPETKTRYEA